MNDELQTTTQSPTESPLPDSPQQENMDSLITGPGTAPENEAAGTPTQQPFQGPEMDLPLPMTEATETITEVEQPVPQPTEHDPLLWILLAVLAAAIIGVGLLLVLKRRKPARKVERISDTQTGEDSAGCLIVGEAQTIGTRTDQEDSFYTTNWKNSKEYFERGLLAVVADGIGGLDNGEIASQTAVKNMRELFYSQDPRIPPAERLLDLAASAHFGVLEYNRSGHRIGSTLVTVLIQRGMMWLASVGDSRICLYRGGALITMNRPHVFGKENQERLAFDDGGVQSDERMDKRLTAHLGKEDLSVIDRTVTPIRLLPGDKVVLMTDGVFGTLDEDVITACLSQEPQSAAASIIHEVEAKKKAAQDNATVVIIGVE